MRLASSLARALAIALACLLLAGVSGSALPHVIKKPKDDRPKWKPPDRPPGFELLTPSTPYHAGYKPPPGTTPSRPFGGTTGRRKVSGSGGESWDVWWLFNGDALLRLGEARQRCRIVSGSADWLLGAANRTARGTEASVTSSQIRRRIVPALLDALDDPFWDVRASAVHALAKIGDRSALPRILALLADDDPRVSEAATLALGVLGEPAAGILLREILRDTPRGRELVGRPSEIPTPTRGLAAIALGLLATDAAAAELLDIVQDSASFASNDVPASAVAALGLMGGRARPVVPGLLCILHDDRRNDPVVRSAVAVALAKIGDPDAIPHLRRALLADPSLDVRRAAVLALGGLATPDDRISVELLTREVRKGSDPLGRGWACIALARIGGVVALKNLVAVVEQDDGGRRAWGAIALGLLLDREPNDAALRGLRDGLVGSRDQSTRAAFALALGIARDADTAPQLVRVLLEPHSPGLRGYCALALGLLGARDAAPVLRNLVAEERDPFVRENVAIALGLIGDRGATASLVELLRGSVTEVLKMSAAQALGRLGDPTSLEALRAILLDRDGAADLVRTAAATALGVLGDPRPVPPLTSLGLDANYPSAVDPVVQAFRSG